MEDSPAEVGGQVEEAAVAPSQDVDDLPKEAEGAAAQQAMVQEAPQGAAAEEQNLVAGEQEEVGAEQEDLQEEEEGKEDAVVVNLEQQDNNHSNDEEDDLEWQEVDEWEASKWQLIPDEFAAQASVLREMGFGDVEAIISLLRQHKGNTAAVAATLLA
jgi:hypothetical protein